MLINKMENNSNKTFEDIKHIDEFGEEFWYARELMKVLQYSKWENFNKVIKKAMISCENSGISIKDCFPDLRKPIFSGKGKEEFIEEYKLTRYACYLIAQNGDSRKKVIALAQTYFAIQTRKGNYSLNKAAKNAGVKNFDKFHNSGYKGLYNGETADDIAKRKGLRYREEILDNMGSDELIANLFRISQTEQKLRKDDIKGENKANSTHYEVGKKIRKAIADIGGTMPEELPTPKKSLKQLEKEKNSRKRIKN